MVDLRIQAEFLAVCGIWFEVDLSRVESKMQLHCSLGSWRSCNFFLVTLMATLEDVTQRMHSCFASLSFSLCLSFSFNFSCSALLVGNSWGESGLGGASWRFASRRTFRWERRVDFPVPQAASRMASWVRQKWKNFYSSDPSGMGGIPFKS